MAVPGLAGYGPSHGLVMGLDWWTQTVKANIADHIGKRANRQTSRQMGKRASGVSIPEKAVGGELEVAVGLDRQRRRRRA